MNWSEFAPWLIGAYFVGSIPFGLLLGKAAGIDVRVTGSGNIGATNVWRSLGWKLGLTAFLLDVTKGAASAWAAGTAFASDGFSTQHAIVAGAAAVVGHTFSPFLRFRGGKGVAAALGVVASTSPDVAIMSFGLFLCLLAATRFVSLASLISCALTPILAYFRGYPTLVIGVYSVLAAYIIAKHLPNIQRLLSGTERRFTVRGGRGVSKESEPLIENKTEG